MRRAAFAFVPLVLTLTAAQAESTVTVDVQDIRNQSGRVLVDLCTIDEGLSGQCRLHATLQAVPGQVSATFDHVAPGVYAAWAWHDENGRGRLERNMFGNPREGVGYSNDAESPLDPPPFAAASFDVGTRNVRISVRMRYHRR